MKLRNVLLVLTIVPVICGLMVCVPGGDYFGWSGSKAWFITGTNDVKNGFWVLSPEEIFGKENLKPAANIKVIAYYRPEEKIESVETDVGEDGIFHFMLLKYNEPYILVFKKDEKVLLRTSPIYISEMEDQEFVLVDDESIDYDANDIDKYLQANLSPNAYNPPRLINNNFFFGYFIFNALIIITLWVMYFVRKFRKQDKQIDQQKQV